MTVFDYTDYRKFLLDWHRERKASDRCFTLRYIAQNVGFRSASFFSQLTNGRSNMSAELAEKFSSFFGFDKRETDYFLTLVGYNQERSHARKKELFEKLRAFKRSRIRTIDSKLYPFYDKWYYNAIRELLYFFPFTGDFKALAKALNPAISPFDAKRAITKLTKWGLIKKDEQGRFARSDNESITTGPDAHSFYVNNFQHEMLDLAKEALDRFKREERSLSTLTISLSGEGYRKISNAVDAFRRHLLSIAEADSNEERVYQLNLQLFPLTNKITGDEP